MAPRAVGWRLQMFLRNNFLPDLAGIAVRFPIELRDQLHRTNVGRRITVTLQAEAHVERLFLMHLDHLIDAAVAAHAAPPRRDVSLVVKINKVGQAMNLYPRNGLAARVTLAHPLQTRAVLLHLRMA